VVISHNRNVTGKISNVSKVREWWCIESQQSLFVSMNCPCCLSSVLWCEARRYEPSLWTITRLTGCGVLSVQYPPVKCLLFLVFLSHTVPRNCKKACHSVQLLLITWQCAMNS